MRHQQPAAEPFHPAGPTDQIHTWETEGGALPPEPEPPELDDVIVLIEFRGRNAAEAER